MNDKYKNYNLLEEQWIPVMWANGRTSRVGIREALTQAGRIRQIAASNPMDRVAVLRFLLALLYWCKDNPLGDLKITSRDGFPADWFSKLDDNKDYFNLLGEGKRFYQWRKPEDKPLSANYLIHEIPTGDNIWHFRHSRDKVDGLCPACCAMGLIRLPLFATGGGAGKSPGINAKPPIYVMPLGQSLAATLRLSWRQVPNLGTPAWERPDLPLPQTGDVPLLLGLTWLARRVWLADPEQPEANCISCGQKKQLIRQTVFAGLGSTKGEDGSPARFWQDPHAIYEQTKKGDVMSIHAVDALGASDAAAGQWSKIMAGILRKHETSMETKVWVVGFSTVQQCKYLEAVESVVSLPSLQETQASVDKLERWQREFRNLVANVKKIYDEGLSHKRRHEIDIPSAASGIRPNVEHRVCSRLPELLAGGDAAWQGAASEYRPMMKMIAQSLAPGFTVAALRKRREIESVIPNMKPKAETEKRRSPKKGGEE